MPVVTKEQLKIWFSNFKKPPEGEFWAWLDSFRHIMDKVPLDDVDGLKEVLRTKADLVNGVVPEDQLPFSVKTSEVLQIGYITATANTAKVFVHSSGKNRVRLNGVIYERAFANPFTYTAVVNYNKILIIYALPLVGLFFLAEGIEALEAVEPELPEGAFIIRRIVVTPTGQTVEPPIANGIKYNEEDGWRNINLTESVTVLPYNDDLRSSYWIQSSIVNFTIGGIRNGVIDKSASPSWDGKEFWIYNNTGSDLPLNSALVTDSDVFLFSSSIILKPRQSCKVKIHNFALEIVGVLSSGSSFPELGNDGEVLVKSGTNALWSSIIKGVEFLGNAWLKLKLISFQGYTIAQKNAIVSPAEGTLIYQNESPKGFQKYEGGVWTAIGSNISNADLSNISARTFTQGNTFTWNTAGFAYYLKGLVDKTGQAAYTKVVVVHPTTGEKVTRDFADPQATTLAVQNANTAQKTAMRTALLGIATPANPVLQDVSPKFIQKGLLSTIDLIGLNLTLLDPAFIWITKPDNSKIYASNFYNITNNAVTTQWNIPADLPEGEYPIGIQNGVTVQGLSTAKFVIVNSIAYTPLIEADWKRKLRFVGGAEVGSAGSNVATNNFVKLNATSVPGYNGTDDALPAVIFKTKNIFLGSKDWDIAIRIVETQGGGAADNLYTAPYIGLTETTHANFTNILSMIYNTHIWEASRAIKLQQNNGVIDLRNGGYDVRFYISKVGNRIFYRFNYPSFTNWVYYNEAIDTSKDYALFLRDSYHTITENKDHFIEARIMN